MGETVTESQWEWVDGHYYLLDPQQQALGVVCLMPFGCTAGVTTGQGAERVMQWIGKGLRSVTEGVKRVEKAVAARREGQGT